MIYKIFYPSPKFAAIIDSYVFVSSNIIEDGKNKYLNFPDLKPRIIFQLGGGNNSRTTLRGCKFVFNCPVLLAGIQTASCWIEGDFYNHLEVKFKAFGLHQLLGIPQNIFKNIYTPLQDILGTEISEISDLLLVTENIEIRISIIESLFAKLIDKSRYIDTQTSGILDYINQHAGDIRLSNVHEEFFITARTLENRFRNQIGISPKEYCKILKFNIFLSKLKKEKVELTNISYESGYYDQSHAIRFFKEITGITPTEYLSVASSFDKIKLEILSSELENISSELPKKYYSVKN